jgi:predicted enzyme related to lactoylglutathione lyase
MLRGYSPREERNMQVSVGYLVIDTTDPERLAPFYTSLLGVEVAARVGDGDYLVLGAKDGFALSFQRVPEEKAGKNRLHMDLMVEDLDKATAEVESLGGRWVEPGATRELEGFVWRCMADPEGNEFDIALLTQA